MQTYHPVYPTQAIYRQLLRAMSRPGRIHVFPAHQWPADLDAVCETLLDHEVSYHVAAGSPPIWEEMILKLTKARCASLAEADFIITAGSCINDVFVYAKKGVPAWPDRGATIIHVSHHPQPSSTLAPHLSGPGIPGEITPEANPLSAEAWRTLRDQNAEYPLGIDVFFLLGERRVMAIPRSTRICMG